jgi:hypothetical protein
LRARASLRRLAGLILLTVLSGATRSQAENLVTVRGAYFREPSTRVVQPTVELAKDLPGGWDVRANYLLDAISSASVAAGTLNGDNIFTEVRNEVGLQVGLKLAQTQLSLGYHYSAEADYWSHAINGAVAQHLWGDTGVLLVSGGIGFDSMIARGRTPICAAEGQLACYLRSYFGGVAYSQVLSPRLIVQAAAEVGYLSGFQANLYRSVPNRGYEQVPDQRVRVALAPRIAYYIPRTQTGLQLHYRYYRDSWSVDSHTVEGRLYQTLTTNLDVRLSYRHYFQTPADFWCDWMAHPDCYAPTARYYPGDPKLARNTTKMPEVKFIWEAASLRDVPFFGWFAAGTFEVGYARYFQSNRVLGDAHLLQLGYSMPY